jgi:hypothetical protein
LAIDAYVMVPEKHLFILNNQRWCSSKRYRSRVVRRILCVVGSLRACYFGLLLHGEVPRTPRGGENGRLSV